MDPNKKTYSNKKVINYYKNYESLQPPEKTIFDLLKNDLPQFKMLDIGIGAGRTTLYFAPRVKEYTGVDYAEGMVETCKRKFSTQFPKLNFKVEDVRHLQEYKENSFDFVLFSFNGIDYISGEERFSSMIQINKILKRGAFFCFSSHNIQTLSQPVRFKLRLNLIALAKQFFIWQKVKRINKETLKNVKTSNFIFINDGAHDFGLETFYFKPSYQQELLVKAGFKNIRFFSLETGQEIKSDKISNSTDRWIYYLCEKV